MPEKINNIFKETTILPQPFQELALHIADQCPEKHWQFQAHHETDTNNSYIDIPSLDFHNPDTHEVDIRIYPPRLDESNQHVAYFIANNKNYVEKFEPNFVEACADDLPDPSPLFLVTQGVESKTLADFVAEINNQK